MTNIDKLIQKYFEGETSLEDENTIRSYFKSEKVSPEHKYLKDVFQFFESEQKLGSNFEPDLSFVKSGKPKVRHLLPKLMGIAASLLILVTLSTYWFNTNETLYKNKYTQLEDPDEALEITLEALGFLGEKFNKGTESMSHMKNLEKTAVFKFDK